MRRNEHQPARPTAGCLSVPLFNQKKRNRVPLTSTPSENEFFSHSEYMGSSSSATSHSSPDTFGCYEASAPSSAGPQSHQWSRQTTPQSAPLQQFGSNRPAAGPSPATRNHAPIPHPYKARDTSFKMGQKSNPVRHQGPREYEAPCTSERVQTKPSLCAGFRPPSLTHQYSQQPRPGPAPAPPPSRPPAHQALPQSNAWKFTNSFGPQRSLFEGNGRANPPARHTPAALPVKPPSENSLRILTAVIGGMRHWSQFKDKVPYLFEIFATLDSAVTLGRHGAKNFLMRDGKEVVQCVFYENEQELPRLIRGQVHRCVGNYNRSGDVLVCVSVRAGLPSELRNAQEAVKACDAEMRAVVKSLSEV